MELRALQATGGATSDPDPEDRMQLQETLEPYDEVLDSLGDL